MAKCIACGKPLSDPKSIEVGMGPVCRGKEAAAASEAPEDNQTELP